MTTDPHILLIYGGRSAEHDISIRSARNVFAALHAQKHPISLVWIDHSGRWFLSNADQLHSPTQTSASPQVALIPGAKGAQLMNVSQPCLLSPIDILFPVLHGPYGEDGTLQGLARMVGVPCVGSSVLGSAVSMDKDVTRRLLTQAGMHCTPALCFRSGQSMTEAIQYTHKHLGFPVYVKPANMGSSVGITRVTTPKQLPLAIEHALKFDRKILIEQEVIGRELECAVLGNDDPRASTVGEIVTAGHFYSYENKYLHEDQTKLLIPAPLSAETQLRIQTIAQQAFQVLELQGMARVDFFLTEENRIYVNEVNTLPGFTSISMYPKLWEDAQLPCNQLTEQLLQLALQSYKP